MFGTQINSRSGFTTQSSVMETAKIYALACPITLEVKYVGQTTKGLKERLSGHCNEDKTSPKAMWIKALATERLRPNIILLQSVPIDQGNVAEQFWLETFRANGMNLLNHNNFYPHAFKVGSKVQVTADTYRLWCSLKTSGDLTALAEILGSTPAKVKHIIDTRKGTQEQIDTINEYFQKKAA